MIIITEKEFCSGCMACFNACKQNCINMNLDEEGFWYPEVDKRHCIDCGVCEKICPIIHKRRYDESRSTTAFAAINNDEEIRLKSSSGGMFTLIAETILDQGGVVFGAAFDESFKSVHHICVDNKTDLDKLRGSKYVQSKIEDTYLITKKLLDRGRKVLFTGTPCQIGGLYSYLKKSYDNLYTQDIICHGVPSPMVWERYVDERERKAESKTQRMFFRYKKYGWKTFAVLFEFANNTTYVKNLNEDSYMRAFLSNICLRPSCYDCSFKSVKRQADITLADFWGIKSVLPEMDDDKGTSLVMIHSDKGKHLIECISDNFKCHDVDIGIIESLNPSVKKSVAVNSKREQFFRNIQKDSFEKTVFKYTKPNIYRRIRDLVGRIKNKIYKLF